MGGLGFGIPAAIGIRMATPERQVVALVGDGASLYSIQALWTAVRYRVGALVVVLANGGYAIMDRLMEMEGGAPPWPGFPEIDYVGLAQAFGCPAEKAATQDELERILDEVVPALEGRDEPLVLVVSVAPDETFEP
jgi:benzoylformate decarboxylase